jgi:hypothetical protein
MPQVIMIATVASQNSLAIGVFVVPRAQKRPGSTTERLVSVGKVDKKLPVSRSRYLQGSFSDEAAQRRKESILLCYVPVRTRRLVLTANFACQFHDCHSYVYCNFHDIYWELRYSWQ